MILASAFMTPGRGLWSCRPEGGRVEVGRRGVVASRILVSSGRQALRKFVNNGKR